MKSLDVEQERMLQEAVAAALGSRERWVGQDVVLQVKTEAGGAEAATAVESVMSTAVRSAGGNVAAAPAVTGTSEGASVETLSSLVSNTSGAVKPLVSMLTSEGSNSGGSSWVQWLNPIAGGLLSLFGGGDSEPAPAVLMPYARARKQQYKAGFGDSGGDVVMPVDYGQDGVSRANGGQAAQSIVVQVQAMDSRSFLDHTPEIAQAVKRALLENEGLPAAMNEF